MAQKVTRRETHICIAVCKNLEDPIIVPVMFMFLKKKKKPNTWNGMNYPLKPKPLCPLVQQCLKVYFKFI